MSLFGWLWDWEVDRDKFYVLIGSGGAIDPYHRVFRPWRWVRRHPTVVWCAGVTLALLFVWALAGAADSLVPMHKRPLSTMGTDKSWIHEAAHRGVTEVGCDSVIAELCNANDALYARLQSTPQEPGTYRLTVRVDTTYEPVFFEWLEGTASWSQIYRRHIDTVRTWELVKQVSPVVEWYGSWQEFSGAGPSFRAGPVYTRVRRADGTLDTLVDSSTIWVPAATGAGP